MVYNEGGSGVQNENCLRTSYTRMMDKANSWVEFSSTIIPQ